VDVGAGSGRITEALVAAGARVVAVELHPGRAAALRRQFARDLVVVVRADACDLRLPRRPFKVVANPPFASTTALLRRLTHRASRLERAVLVLPSWATARWSNGRGAGGAARDAFVFRAGPWVPTTAFHPPAPPAKVLVVERR